VSVAIWKFIQCLMGSQCGLDDLSWRDL